MEWALLATAIAGGAWGAAVGAVPAFIFTGVLALVGAVAAAAGSPELLAVAFGPAFGPHVSFAGGVGAAAFAGARGYLTTGRDIVTPLMGLRRVDALLVGGGFGAVGWWVNGWAIRLGAGAWTDTIAVTVVLTAVAARLLFGRTPVIGRAGADGRRFQPSDSAAWLPWQQHIPHVLLIGGAVGALAAYLVVAGGLRVGADSLAFGIATSVLLFLVMGQKVPVTHHIALPAALAVLHGGGFLGGIVCGMAGAVAGEMASRVLLIHGDTHIDPPAVGIALVVLGLRVSAALGWIPGPVS